MRFTLRRPFWSLHQHFETIGATFYHCATEDGVITMSRWHLMCLQEGTLDEYTKVINDGIVAGTVSIFDVLLKRRKRIL